MKVRYRNRATGEARDITVGSAEETTVKTAVFTVNGESLPLWVLEAEYAEIMARESEKLELQFVPNQGSRRLTPGEREMGITSYEQKVRENNPDLFEEGDDEAKSVPEETPAEEPVVNEDDLDETDEEDDDEDEENDAAAAAPKPRPRRAPRRAPSRSAR